MQNMVIIFGLKGSPAENQNDRGPLTLKEV